MMSDTTVLEVALEKRFRLTRSIIIQLPITLILSMKQPDLYYFEAIKMTSQA